MSYAPAILEVLCQHHFLAKYLSKPNIFTIVKESRYNNYTTHPMLLEESCLVTEDAFKEEQPYKCRVLRNEKRQKMPRLTTQRSKCAWPHLGVQGEVIFNLFCFYVNSLFLLPFNLGENKSHYDLEFYLRVVQIIFWSWKSKL